MKNSKIILKSKTDEAGKLESILSAAQKRFGYYGLCKTTMNEIASDVGLSKASLYYYFPDKECLFEKVIEKEQDHFINEINRIIFTKAKSSQLLLRYVKLRQGYFKEFLNLGKLKFDSMITSKPIMCSLIKKFNHKEQELIESIIQAGIQNKEFKKVNVAENAQFFIHMMMGFRLVTLKNNDSPELSSKDYLELNKYLIRAASMFIKELIRTPISPTSRTI